MKSEPVSNQLLHEFMGYESSNEKIQIIYVEYILQQIIKKKKKNIEQFFLRETSAVTVVNMKQLQNVLKCQG